MKRTLLLLCFLVIAMSNVLGQGYDIKVTIDDAVDSTLVLGYYYNGKTYAADTSTVGESGEFHFKGEQSLQKGMYFLLMKDDWLTDMVIGNDQTFELKTASPEYTASMKVEGDLDNQLFFDNLLFTLDRKEKADPFVAILNDTTATPESRKEAETAYNAISEEVETYTDSILLKHPDKLISAWMGINKRLKIPDEVAASMDIADQDARFKYYKTHYWDYIDLGNSALLRVPNPIYRNKIDDYLDNLVYPHPDSLIAEVDALMEVAKASEETGQYLVWHLVVKYQTSKILGYDKIYVHLIDRYFMTGEMDYWANEQLKKNLKESADRLRYSLLGLVAPNLVLKNLEGQPSALHDMKNEYTVIYFYDPDCGHCKKETPVLKEYVASSTFDIGVFSVSADTSMIKMENYVKEVGLEDWTNTNGTRTYGLDYQKVYDAFTTPTIYLLDRNKKIIAKKIAASQLNEVLTRHEQN